MRERTCVLCNATTDIEVALVDWKDVERRSFDFVPRCRDRQACRSRVEQPKPAGLGEEWPVRDSTFPTLPLVTRSPVVDEPVQEPADDEEAPAWL